MSMAAELKHYLMELVLRFEVCFFLFQGPGDHWFFLCLPDVRNQCSVPYTASEITKAGKILFLGNKLIAGLNIFPFYTEHTVKQIALLI